MRANSQGRRSQASASSFHKTGWKPSFEEPQQGQACLDPRSGSQGSGMRQGGSGVVDCTEDRPASCARRRSEQALQPGYRRGRVIDFTPPPKRQGSSPSLHREEQHGVECLEPIPSPPLLDSVRGDRGEIDLTLAPCTGSPADPVQLEPAQPPLHRIPPQPTDRPPSVERELQPEARGMLPAASGTPLLPESRCHCPRTGSSSGPPCRPGRLRPGRTSPNLARPPPSDRNRRRRSTSTPCRLPRPAATVLRSGEVAARPRGDPARRGSRSRRPGRIRCPSSWTQSKCRDRNSRSVSRSNSLR